MDAVPLFENYDDRSTDRFETDDELEERWCGDRWGNEEEDSSLLDREGPIPTTPSEFVEAAVMMPYQGKLLNFSFEDRSYLRSIYDSPAPRKLLMAGRQVEKSTLLGNSCLAYTAINPYFRTLYVSPSNQQTKVFSRDRIAEPIHLSPFLQRTTNSRLLKNVFEKKFVNHAQITLRFAFLNADRTRGIPADAVTIDEFQDILLENVPVIEECASHSDYKLFTYAGTPKSFDNAIEHYWSRFSTQNEWAVPCRRHGTPKNPGTWHWNILDEENVGEKSLVCDRCGEEIWANDKDATWVSLNPNPKVEKPYEGYRIPQLMVPWIDWSDIRNKQRIYSRAKFHNEVLGRSYDSGTRPLTRRDMQRNCWDELSMQYYREVIQYCQQYPIFMGVDWGCHDDQTRILTDRGFVHFKDLTDDDRVAQFDKDNRDLTFVKPIARTVRDWDGDLLHFEAKGLDMMLTGTHRMLFKGKNANDFKVERAGDFVKRTGQVKFVGSTPFQAGESKPTFTLPGLPSSPGYPGCEPVTFKMIDWLEFLGYFLSEGGLCWVPRRGSEEGQRPSCLKMSQRESANPEITGKIRACLDRLGLEYQEYPNPKTGDVNWTICGKQFWYWVEQNIGGSSSTKRIPREFMRLSVVQLHRLWYAMMSGDGSYDTRENCNSGNYTSTSKGLCEDFQELCILLGMRATLSLHKEAEGNRKTRWRVSWATPRDYTFNDPSRVKKVPYKGKVYCCKVPTGFIVTERNGRIGYQGNTGEGTYTVACLGGYLPFRPDRLTWFWWKRFEGVESEPRRQLAVIRKLIYDFNVRQVGVDYGGGFWPNDELTRDFGAEKIKKYQWVGNVKVKVKWDPNLGIPRHLCHRTEVMSDVFNAIKRADVFCFPRWEEFDDPHAQDFLNIYSEYNDRLRMNVYKTAPSHPDDSFHAMAFGFLASFYVRPRPDVLLPSKEVTREQHDPAELIDIVSDPSHFGELPEPTEPY